VIGKQTLCKPLCVQAYVKYEMSSIN